MDAQKTTPGASERDEQARAAFREQVAPAPAERFVIIDDCGSNLNLSPRYAYALGGERAIGLVPRNTERNTTLSAAMTTTRLDTALLLEGATDGDAFEAYVAHVRAPSLRPGQIVVVDNLSAHKRERVRALIEERGCQRWFLPAPSPALSPIEEAFSTRKHLVRRAEARSREALDATNADARQPISPADAQAIFAHLGYGVKAQ